MAKIWITGATGAIGSACYNILSETQHELYASNAIATVRSNESLKVFMADKEPDTLVYAAGINYLDWSQDINIAEMSKVYDVNVLGFMRCLQAAPDLKRVVVIGSDAARRPMRTSIAYNASKAALEAAVKVIARERAAFGFIINLVAPGLIEEGRMTEYVYARTRELRPRLDLNDYMIGNIPAGRAGKAIEVAMVVKWLVDEAPDYVNGSIIDVNGAR